MISLDTETTGLDLHHGARPFCVTIAKEDGEQLYWEWEVDPLTRQVAYDPSDGDAILELLYSNPVVTQNGKFDVSALTTLDSRFADCWDWETHEDTLIAGHLLASNRQKDLTSLAITYLGADISRFEDEAETACKEARALARGLGWGIAKKGREDMPSAKEKTWKYDMWLPATVARLHPEAARDNWTTVTKDYAEADSAVTLLLINEMLKEIHRRGLYAIYRDRMKLVPIFQKMEMAGVTMKRNHRDRLEKEFAETSGKLGVVCIDVAAKWKTPYELDLPKGGVNNSLRTFVFDLQYLNILADIEINAEVSYDRGSGSSKQVIPRSDKTGLPSFDKNVLGFLCEEYPPMSRKSIFFRSLRLKRKYDTALGFLDSYRRFLVGDTLYPSINLTGTDTLRRSSSNPNEQQISKQEEANIRECFGPDDEGEWWSIDAKNIELRIPAYESGEAEIIELFENPDRSPYFGSTHLLNFHTVYPELWDKAVREVGIDNAGSYCKNFYKATNYQWCKNGGFAVQYGAVDKEGGGGTADKAFHRIGAHALLRSRFDKLETLNRKWIRFAEKHGYVETLPDRSVDPTKGYPLLVSRTDYGRILPTVPLNYHVQGTAMQWTSRGMIKVDDFLGELNRKKFKARLAWQVMEVHDELVFRFPRGWGIEPWRMNLPYIREIERLLKSCGDDIGISTPVGISYHADNWKDELVLQ